MRSSNSTGLSVSDAVKMEVLLVVKIYYIDIFQQLTDNLILPQPIKNNIHIILRCLQLK